MMKPLTTSVYTFEKLCDGGFLYVDKTAGIYELIEPAFAQYFLSRPRRFGKSLLGHLGQESAREIQAVLKQFYSVVKTTEAQ